MKLFEFQKDIIRDCETKRLLFGVETWMTGQLASLFMGMERERPNTFQDWPAFYAEIGKDIRDLGISYIVLFRDGVNGRVVEVVRVDPTEVVDETARGGLGWIVNLPDEIYGASNSRCLVPSNHMIVVKPVSAEVDEPVVVEGRK